MWQSRSSLLQWVVSICICGGLAFPICIQLNAIKTRCSLQGQGSGGSHRMLPSHPVRHVLVGGLFRNGGSRRQQSITSGLPPESKLWHEVTAYTVNTKKSARARRTEIDKKGSDALFHTWLKSTFPEKPDKKRNQTSEGQDKGDDIAYRLINYVTNEDFKPAVSNQRDRCGTRDASVTQTFTLWVRSDEVVARSPLLRRGRVDVIRFVVSCEKIDYFRCSERRYTVRILYGCSTGVWFQLGNIMELSS